MKIFRYFVQTVRSFILFYTNTNLIEATDEQLFILFVYNESLLVVKSAKLF